MKSSKSMLGLMMVTILLISCSESQDNKLRKIFRDESTLFDPESVQFRNVTSSKDGKHYCGELNSKNRLGGYVGWKRFILPKDNGEVALIFVQGQEFSDGKVDKETEKVILNAGEALCALSRR